MASSGSLGILMGKQVLITGSSGQIGSAVAKVLCEAGAVVTGLDTVPGREFSGSEFVKCSITDRSALRRNEKKFARVQILVHLAGRVQDSREVPEKASEEIGLDIEGTLNLLEAMPSLQRVVYSSSYMVYGPANKCPVDESHPTEPANIYGTCKLAAEKYLAVYCRGKGISLANLRLMGVYGPGTPAGGGRAIPIFISKALSGEPLTVFGRGASRRNYIYLDDAAQAIGLAAASGISGAYNIGGPDAPSVMQIAQAVAKTAGIDRKITRTKATGPEHDFICSTLKAKSELGFASKVRFFEGISLHVAHEAAYRASMGAGAVCTSRKPQSKPRRRRLQ